MAIAPVYKGTVLSLGTLTLSRFNAKGASLFMIKEYLKQNVYEALQERLKYLFEEFDNIYVSFSGGKDSGLLLEVTLDFQKKYLK